MKNEQETMLLVPRDVRDRAFFGEVAEYIGVSMVVVESDLLPPEASVVVIPLLSGYPAVRRLNPEPFLCLLVWLVALLHWFTQGAGRRRELQFPV